MPSNCSLSNLSLKSRMQTKYACEPVWQLISIFILFHRTSGREGVSNLLPMFLFHCFCENEALHSNAALKFILENHGFLFLIHSVVGVTTTVYNDALRPKTFSSLYYPSNSTFLLGISQAHLLIPIKVGWMIVLMLRRSSD